MRNTPLLLSVLPYFARGQTYDNGQWTVVPTVVSWSQSYIYSYRSTEIITITTLVPCPVYTSYTTVTQCSECGCPGCDPNPPVPVTDFACATKTCKYANNGETYYTETAYGPGEYAPASTSPGGSTSYVDPSTCPTFVPFISPVYVGPEVTACGVAPIPEPNNRIACLLKPCFTSTEGAYAPFVTGEPYASDQNALAELNGETVTTPATDCSIFTEPSGGINTANILYPIESCTASGSGGGAVVTTGRCAPSVVQYSYTTNGATVIMQTTIQQKGCGPFTLSGKAVRGRVSGEGANVLLWIWSGLAVLSGIGMIVL